MREYKDITYASLFKEIIGKSNFTPEERESKENKELMALLKDEKRVADILDEKRGRTISAVDMRIISRIKDFGTLKEYFLKRYSDDFIDDCVSNDYRVGNYASSLVDWSKGIGKDIAFTKHMIKSKILSQYDGKTTINGLELNRQKFTSPKHVINHIRAIAQSKQEERQVTKRQKREEKESLNRVIKKMEQAIPELEQKIEDSRVKAPKTTIMLYCATIACDNMFLENAKDMLDLYNDPEKYREIELEDRQIMLVKKAVSIKLEEGISKNQATGKQVQKMEKALEGNKPKTFTQIEFDR